MNFKTSKIPILTIVFYQIAGLPILIKYVPIFMSHSHDVLESYPLYIYSAGWIVLFGFFAFKGRQEEVNELGLSSLQRTSGRGIHFPREKAWLYNEMPLSLSHPDRKGRGHVECLAYKCGSIVIFWLPRNLKAGIYINNLEIEPKVVMVRAKFLSYDVTPKWKEEFLAVQDPSFKCLRYFGRNDIEPALHSGELLNKITDLVDFISHKKGRLIIEDSLIAAYFPEELPDGNELFPRAYKLWQEVARVQWPRKDFNPFDNRRSAISLIIVAAIIVAFIAAISSTLRR